MKFLTFVKINFQGKLLSFLFQIMAVFILEDALSVQSNLGEHLSFVWLYASSIKTGTRRIIHQRKLSSVMRRSSRTTEDSSSRRIMRFVPVFILETYNQTNDECSPKFDQTDNASASIKTANNRNVFVLVCRTQRCFKKEQREIRELLFV